MLKHTIEDVQSENDLLRQDCTKMLLYMRCPRRYFFEHILGKRTEGSNFHLIYGRAIHEGMEIVIMRQTADDVTKTLTMAMDAFDKVYLNEMPEDMMGTYKHKTRENAHLLFKEYMQYYHNDSFDPLYTEVAGEVGIGNNQFGQPRTMMFKIDAIIKNHADGKLWILEHKTATRKSDEQWQAHIQPRLYLHVLHSLKSEVEIGGTIMNTLILKDPNTKVAQTRQYVNEFNRERLILSGDQMLSFLDTVNEWVSRIEEDYRRYLVQRENGMELTAFPQACSSCYDYFRICPYNNICAFSRYKADQEFNASGFVDFHWDPLKEFKQLKEKE